MSVTREGIRTEDPRPASLLFSVGPHSLGHLKAHLFGGRPGEQMVALLRDRFPALSSDFPSVAVQMPPEDARALASKARASYCMPWVTGPRGRGLGLPLVPTLHLGRGSTEPERSEGQDLTPEFLQDLADRLRRWAPSILQADPAAQATLRTRVASVQAAKDAIVEAGQQSRRAFPVELLIRGVLLSGLLRGAAELRDALRLAVSAAVPPSVAQPFLAALADADRRVAPLARQCFATA